MKRILALIGACLLVFLYIMTFVTALMSTPESKDWLSASIGATVIVPVVIYAYMMFARVSSRHEEQSRRHEEIFFQQMKDQVRRQQEEKARAEKEQEKDQEQEASSQPIDEQIEQLQEQIQQLQAKKQQGK